MIISQTQQISVVFLYKSFIVLITFKYESPNKATISKRVPADPLLLLTSRNSENCGNHPNQNLITAVVRLPSIIII